MKDGFIRVAAATPKIKVADCKYNTAAIIEMIGEAYENQVKIIVFPELCITGYTCNDLFFQNTLLDGAIEGLSQILDASRGKEMLIFVGLPYMHLGKLYNVAAVVRDGRLLAMIPKKNIPNYSEFYEARHFNPGQETPIEIFLLEQNVYFGTNIILRAEDMPELMVAAEICEDVWAPMPPGISHVLAGATVLVNCSASNETICKDVYRRELVKGQSAKLVCGYVYTSAGEGESTQDLVFAGHDIICENGTVIGESSRFSTGILYSDMDLQRIASERRRMTTFTTKESPEYQYVDFFAGVEDVALDLKRPYEKTPFVPSDANERNYRCESILSIQSMGLKKRLEHTGCKNAVIGISGGLDSTLALLVTVRAFDLLQIDRKNITAVTMPCFGTTDRTYQNAVLLTKKLGATLREIDIKEAVTVHFRDIGHDPSVHDVTYENGQARERTQILMDIANQNGGMVIGTGDMSELALGWATYNGDHMSMYGVNASVPKTLVRHLVRYYADTCKDAELSGVLEDILDTPVSPELLPPQDGMISQKTEDLVGPYELHDFFLYHVLRFGYTPSKIYRIARIAFEDEYDDAVILKWLKTFYRRFFTQQFKRSCLPDGPKVGSVALSPRGDLRMPSDASYNLWMAEVESL
ncbi:MAG: NAD(+) synthase [Thermoflexaceae bacterium]|nr:NAD(+) synthase [Thermoflexaceae bacterium]